MAIHCGGKRIVYEFDWPGVLNWDRMLIVFAR